MTGGVTVVAAMSDWTSSGAHKFSETFFSDDRPVRGGALRLGDPESLWRRHLGWKIASPENLIIASSLLALGLSRKLAFVDRLLSLNSSNFLLSSSCVCF